MNYIDRLQTICAVHSAIREMFDELGKMRAKDYRGIEDPEEMAEKILDDVNTQIFHADQLVAKATEMGQKMEDRMKEYRDAVEGLGFTRDRDIKPERLDQVIARVFNRMITKK